MPFRPQVFQEAIEGRVGEATREGLAQACAAYDALTTPLQKARCIKGMMDALDQAVDAPTRQTIMQACGRQCIGASTLDKARKIAKAAPDLDAMLEQLNQVHIGGGHLHREGDVIHAAYTRCYCGSVNQAKEPFSATYCHCSCGWFRQLFETLLGRPVEVELVSSIIQGDESCRFLIHTQPSQGA
jgi:predicted hydrocarbon binding protein